MALEMTGCLPILLSETPALTDQPEADGRSVVETHLLEAQCSDESDAGEAVSFVGSKKDERPEGEAEHDGVELEVAVVDQDERRREEEEEEDHLLHTLTMQLVDQQGELVSFGRTGETERNKGRGETNLCSAALCFGLVTPINPGSHGTPPDEDLPEEHTPSHERLEAVALKTSGRVESEPGRVQYRAEAAAEVGVVGC
jgi:hypothetical protein